MRYILFFLFFYESMLPVKGQCTLSAYTDICTGSHACSIEAQEEYHKNVQIKLEELSFKLERIGERFDDADEPGKIMSKEHCHDLLNVCQNLSVKIDSLSETANGEDKCFVDKDLDQMYQNLSLRLEIIDEKFQSTDRRLLLLSKAEQNNTDRSTIDAIDGIHKKIDNAEQSIKERIESHDLSLQRLDQNISTEVERIDGRLQSLLQQVGEIYHLVKQMVCPYGFDYVTEINQCLYLNLELMTWDNARNACARKKTGAQLVSVKDSSKQMAVRRYLQNQFTKSESAVCNSSSWSAGGKTSWLSGQTRNPSTCSTDYYWKPVGATETPFNYTNWDPKQPDCYVGKENCVVIASSPRLDYRWNDLPCGALICSLCEF